MQQRLNEMRARVRARTHRSLRQAPRPMCWRNAMICNSPGPGAPARLTRRMCQAEQPVIGHDERIVFTRTLPSVPPIYSPEQWAELAPGQTLHELGPINNICADWGMVLAQGLAGRERLHWQRSAADMATTPPPSSLIAPSRRSMLCSTLPRATLGRRRRRDGRIWRKRSSHVPAYRPRTFHEALQSLRLLHAVVVVERPLPRGPGAV